MSNDLKYKEVMFKNFSETGKQERAKKANENIPAMLDIVMHNQAVLNYKLNQLLEK